MNPALTPEERARRAAVLGITLPAPAAAPVPPKPKPVSSPSNGSRLAATPAMRAAVAVKPPPPAPAPALPPAEPVELKADRFKRVRTLLQARYPQVFRWARPLAVGIDQQIRQAIPEAELRQADMRWFLRIWVRRPAYRAALERGDRRVNLDGSDAGPAFAEIRPVGLPAEPERASPPVLS